MSTLSCHILSIIGIGSRHYPVPPSGSGSFRTSDMYTDIIYKCRFDGQSMQKPPSLRKLLKGNLLSREYLPFIPLHRSFVDSRNLDLAAQNEYIHRGIFRYALDVDLLLAELTTNFFIDKIRAQ